MTGPEFPLATIFPASTEADWRAAVQRSKSVAEPRLHGDEGIPIGPICRRWRDATPIVKDNPQQPWRVVQRLTARDAAALAAASAEEVGGGAHGLELALAGSVHPLATAIGAEAASEALGRLVLPAGYALRIDAGMVAAAPARPLIDLAKKFGLELAFTFDPLAAIAARGSGGAGDAWEGDFLRLAEALDAAGLGGAAANADGRIWHAGGASAVQELAATLASFAAYVRALAGLSVEQAMRRVAVALAADADQLVTTAKFRAMRLLLQRVAEVAGIAAPAIRIHGETAWRMMSRREPRMNILRAAGAAFAAATGGADSIATLPFDVLEEEPSEAARRLARNTQIVLAEEAQVGRFADPSAGAGAVESLTDAFAQAVWERFQRIESEGGMPAAVRRGSLQREIAATREARLARMRSGEMRMIGVNAFAETGSLAARPIMPPADAHASDRLVFVRLAGEAEAAR